MLHICRRESQLLRTARVFFSKQRMKGIEIALLVAENDERAGGVKGVVEYHQQRFKAVCPQVNLTPFPVCDGVFPNDVEDFPMYVITGARCNVDRNVGWMSRLEEFIRKVHKRPEIRMVSICFGHQITASALGGQIGMNLCGEFIWNCEKVHVTKEFSDKQYYKNANLGSSSFYVMQSHEQEVLRKPEDAQLMGGSAKCRYEILLYGNNILTFQGHPEREKGLMLSRIPQNRNLSEEQIESSLKSFNNDQGQKTTNLIIQFLTSSSSSS